MEGSREGQVPRSEGERLAKEWLLRLIEGTPLPDVGELPVSWIAAEAPPLIADITAALAEPATAAERELDPERRRRAASLRRLREGPGAAEQIPRDLAALQALMVESIRREIPERRPGDFAHAVSRLAEVFGSIQGAVAGSLVEERGGGAAVDPLTGLPGSPQLEEWLRILLAGHRRYEHGFALALVEIEGLAQIYAASGNDAGDRLIAVVAGMIERQIRETDHAFRLEQGEFAILAPYQDADGMEPMLTRIARLLESAQAPGGAGIAIAAGIAACPAHGETVEELLESATQASFAAKAAGEPVAKGPGAPTTVQDS